MKNKKKVIGILLVVLALIAIVANCGDKKEQPSVEPEETASVEQQENTKDDEDVKTNSETEKQMQDAILMILKDSCEGTANVEWNEDLAMFRIIPTDSNLILALSMLPVVEKNDPIYDSWVGLLESICELSKSIPETLDCSLGLVNPASKDRLLLVAKDGVITYNFMDEY